MKALQKKLEKFIAASESLRSSIESAAKATAPFIDETGKRRFTSISEANYRAEIEARALLTKMQETT